MSSSSQSTAQWLRARCQWLALLVLLLWLAYLSASILGSASPSSAAPTTTDDELAGKGPKRRRNHVASTPFVMNAGDTNSDQDFDGSTTIGGPLLRSGPYRAKSFSIPGISQQHLDHASQLLGVWAYQHVLNRHIFFKVDGSRTGYQNTGSSLPQGVSQLDVPPSLLEGISPTGESTPYHDGWVSYADPGWNTWFRETFWPAVFAELPDPTIATNADRPTIQYTCSNVLLENAPWCGMFSHELSSFAFDPTALPLPLAREVEDIHPSGGKMIRQVLQVEDNLPTRQELIERAGQYFRGVSKRSSLNDKDKAAIQGIRWRSMTKPSSTTEPISLDALEMQDDRASGEAYLWRTQQRYPILLALRKPDRKAASSENKFRGTFDAQKRLHGLHACFFGEMRNLSSTLDSIHQDVIQQFRPMRVHFVTNDNISQTNFIWEPTTKPEPLTLSPTQRMNLGEARKVILEGYMDLLLPVADTFLVTAGALHRVPTGCHHCRGALSKEMCRMSILSDLDRGYPVEYVLIFRPDSIVRLPFRLFVTVGQREYNLNSTQDITDAMDDTSNNAHPPSRMRLFAPEYRYSIVTDGGVTPAAMSLVSDTSFDPMSAVIVHSRVSYLLDMSWIADPVLFGSWSILNHWLEMFSIHTSCPKHGWVDKYSGEWNQRTFYRSYLRPLFRLGYASKAEGILPIELRPFDFMISLFRPHPLKNKVIFSTNVKYAPYQEQTYFKKFALRWNFAECMYYTYSPRQTNVTVVYPREKLYFRGSVGKLRMTKVPMSMCANAAVPPSVQNCYVQYQRMFYYKKGNNINNPCKPYCNVFPIFMPEGLCLNIGTPSARNKNHATFSETPMWRNESGEVLKFNVVNPQHLIGDVTYKEREKAKQQAKTTHDTALRQNRMPAAGGGGDGAERSNVDKLSFRARAEFERRAKRVGALQLTAVDKEFITTVAEEAAGAGTAQYDDGGATRKNRRSPSQEGNDDRAPTKSDDGADDRDEDVYAKQQRKRREQREMTGETVGDHSSARKQHTRLLEQPIVAAPADDGQTGDFTFRRPDGYGADAMAPIDDEQVRRERSNALRNQGLNQAPKRYRQVKKA